MTKVPIFCPKCSCVTGIKTGEKIRCEMCNRPIKMFKGANNV